MTQPEQEHEQVQQTASEKQPPKHEARREVVEFVKLVVWFLVIFFVIRTYVVEGYEVQGPSMDPTLKDEERILVFKLSNGLSHHWPFRWLDSYKQGDIIVFDSPDDYGKRYVKRVIARGSKRNSGKVDAESHASPNGDYVLFDRGTVYINNKLLDEPYVLPEDKSCHEKDSQHLKPGAVYVLGDNRTESKDSRSFGPVDESQIIGSVIFRFWPLSKFGFVK